MRSEEEVIEIMVTLTILVGIIQNFLEEKIRVRHKTKINIGQGNAQSYQ